MIETGTILQNRYRIDKQIGQGGMGNVYVAADERFKSVVAIKETVFQDASLRKAFEREARLLNSLKHSALPRVSDHFNEGDGQFLVMEFIAGDDLAAMMETSGEAFPLETVLNWARQLCEALEYLHAQDIIHRDIKPQNLKLTPNNQIVLLDFGLAKGNPTDSQNQTAAKSIFGFSRSYASLEQIQGAGTEPRSDLYSLAATLYHLLTGIPPADALTRAMNVLNKQNDPLIPANLVNKQVPKGVAEVLQKAMALNAGERPESANAMRASLEECDKSINTDESQSIVEKSLTTDFLTQETKIMGAATNLSADERSEVETKVSPGRISEQNPYKTRITAAANDGEPKAAFLAENPAGAERPKRSKAVGAAIFGGLILAGTLFSAGYFLNSNSSHSNANTETVNPNGVAVPNEFFTIKTENANVSNANSGADANSVLANTKSADKTTPPSEVSAKQNETTKNNSKETKKQTGNPRAATKSDNSSGEENVFTVNENTDTVETKDMIIDERGIRMKRPQPQPPMPPIVPPEQLKYLTPEQIRKLEQIRRFEQLKNAQKRVIVVKPPTPKPTP
jgi:serine/threonine protein kinase